MHWVCICHGRRSPRAVAGGRDAGGARCARRGASRAGRPGPRSWCTSPRIPAARSRRCARCSGSRSPRPSARSTVSCETGWSNAGRGLTAAATICGAAAPAAASRGERWRRVARRCARSSPSSTGRPGGPRGWPRGARRRAGRRPPGRAARLPALRPEGVLRGSGLPASAHGAVTRAQRLTLSGVACVGSAYGMARYGFGLLLPDMRAALRLSDAAAGAIAAAGYAVYLVVSLRTGRLVARYGPRATVIAGGGCAVAGMLLAAIAPSALALGAAVAVAGASAALVFPPFADAIAAVVPEANRAQAFAWVSSGTGAGVAVAAPLAFLAADWRLTWVLFAVVAALTTLLAARAVPRRRCARTGPTVAPPPTSSRHPAPAGVRSARRARGGGLLDLGRRPRRHRWRSRHRRRSDAARGGRDREPRRGAGEQADRPGWPPRRSRRLRRDAGRVARRAGPRARSRRHRHRGGRLLRAGYNLLVSIQGLWSTRISAHDPARGLAAVMSAMGVGFLLGPLLATPLNQQTAFLAAAALLAAGGCLGLTAPPAPRLKLAALDAEGAAGGGSVRG